MSETGKALVKVSRDEVRELAERMTSLLPAIRKAPLAIRLATAQVALLHGLDPFLKEITAIKAGDGWEPYVCIDGMRRSARDQIKYQRVLQPLTDHWAKEFFHTSAEEVRALNHLDQEDIAWVCAVFIEGFEHPFVELGVCGPSFPTVSRAPKWKIAKVRAERAALKAACSLPFALKYEGVLMGDEEAGTVGGDQESDTLEGDVIEGEATVVGETQQEGGMPEVAALEEFARLRGENALEDPQLLWEMVTASRGDETSPVAKPAGERKAQETGQPPTEKAATEKPRAEKPKGAGGSGAPPDHYDGPLYSPPPGVTTDQSPRYTQFISDVMGYCDYYKHIRHVENALKKMGATWPVGKAEQDDLYEVLLDHAKERGWENSHPEAHGQQRLNLGGK